MGIWSGMREGSDSGGTNSRSCIIHIHSIAWVECYDTLNSFLYDYLF